jgi:hypothetical protein
MKNPLPRIVETWRRATDAAAPVLASRGIRVINCSPISTLKRYVKMEFIEALEAVCRAPAC